MAPVSGAGANLVPNPDADLERELVKKEYDAELDFLRKRLDGTATDQDFEKVTKILKETQKQKLVIQEKKYAELNSLYLKAKDEVVRANLQFKKDTNSIEATAAKKRAHLK